MVEIGLVKCKRLPDDSPPFLRRSFSHIAQINLVMLACLDSTLLINKLVCRFDSNSRNFNPVTVMPLTHLLASRTDRSQV